SRVPRELSKRGSSTIRPPRIARCWCHSTSRRRFENNASLSGTKPRTTSTHDVSSSHVRSRGALRSTRPACIATTDSGGAQRRPEGGERGEKATHATCFEGTPRGGSGLVPPDVSSVPRLP